jgi:hypothetical protein
MVVAPLNPTSLAHQSIPALSSAGNLWNRVPQLRVDHKGSFYMLKAALLRPFSGDAAARTVAGANQVNQTDQPGSGEFGGQPMYQALFELNRTRDNRTCVLGASGSYMKQSFRDLVQVGGINDKVESYTASLHTVLPVHSRLKLQGEWFYSRNNAPFQGLAKVAVKGTHLTGVHSRGGWGEANLRLNPKTSLIVGGGTENPDDTRIATGDPAKNSVAFGNLTWEAASDLVWSAEYHHISTAIKGQREGRVGQYVLSMQYKF